MSQRITQILHRVPVRRARFHGEVSAKVSLLWSPIMPHHLSLMVDVPGRGPRLLPLFPRSTFTDGINGHPVGTDVWSLIPDLSAAPGSAVELVLAGADSGSAVALSLPVDAFRGFLDRTFAVVSDVAHTPDGEIA